MKKNEKLSSGTRGLRYKLRIALYLMSVLPLLVSIYLASNYILPQVGLKIDIVGSLGVSVLIAIIGFFVIKEVFDRILSVVSEAKLIAAGDIHHKIEMPREDEVGDLGDALHQLTLRIRDNMDELKNYGEKTTEINLEIQKRILVLSSLLQISSLISQGAHLDDILKLTVEKSRFIASSEISYLLFREDNNPVFYIKIADGANTQYLSKVNIKIHEHTLNNFAKTAKPFIMDKTNALPEDIRAVFSEQLRMKNTLALPIYMRGKVTGILGIGNNREIFSFAKDDWELLDIFAKQIAIAIENDLLMHRIEKLEIKDPLTGLYNDTFIHNRLQEEIKRAITYQRPCAYILLNIDNFQKYRQNFGSLQAESTLKRVANLVRDSVTEIDRVGRVGDNDFAIVLPERNKRQAQAIAEEIRKKIGFSFNEETDANKRITCSAGISENPLDGIEAEELVTKAKESLGLAKKQGKNNVAS
ncbi:MAG: diguanylate cyclase [Candidatus Omnitrophota bacterium]|jgi:diguanylate cyclase (GGDEF)-like protein